jgi:hypothetical protein
MAGLVKDLQEENQQLMAENQRLNGSLEQVRLHAPLTFDLSLVLWPLLSACSGHALHARVSGAVVVVEPDAMAPC